MSNQPGSTFAARAGQDEEGLLAEWMKRQRAAARRRELINEAPLGEKSRRS